MRMTSREPHRPRARGAARAARTRRECERHAEHHVQHDVGEIEERGTGEGRQVGSVQQQGAERPARKPGLSVSVMCEEAGAAGLLPPARERPAACPVRGIRSVGRASGDGQ